MTGQVKEGILARFGELGVQVEGGIVSFRPVLLGRSEIVSEARAYRFYDLEGELRAEHGLNGMKVGIGIDRMDYIKGIPERLLAVGTPPSRLLVVVVGVTGLLSGLGKHLDSRVDVINTLLPYTRAALEGAS